MRPVKLIPLGCSLDIDRVPRAGASGQDGITFGHHLTRVRTFLAGGDQWPWMKVEGRVDGAGRPDAVSSASGQLVRGVRLGPRGLNG